MDRTLRSTVPKTTKKWTEHSLAPVPKTTKNGHKYSVITCLARSHAAGRRTAASQGRQTNRQAVIIIAFAPSRPAGLSAWWRNTVRAEAHARLSALGRQPRRTVRWPQAHGRRWASRSAAGSSDRRAAAQTNASVARRRCDGGRVRSSSRWPPRRFVSQAGRRTGRQSGRQATRPAGCLAPAANHQAQSAARRRRRRSSHSGRQAGKAGSPPAPAAACLFVVSLVRRCFCGLLSLCVSLCALALYPLRSLCSLSGSVALRLRPVSSNPSTADTDMMRCRHALTSLTALPPPSTYYYSQPPP